MKLHSASKTSRLQDACDFNTGRKEESNKYVTNCNMCSQSAATQFTATGFTFLSNVLTGLSVCTTQLLPPPKKKMPLVLSRVQY